MRASCHLSSLKPNLANAFCVSLFYVAMVVASPAQTLTPLHSFSGSDGMNPYREALVQGADGNFYGTTEMGGTDNFGVVLKMTPDGAVTVIHEFVGTDGEYPSSGLVQDAAGNLYGTTRTGGPGPDPGVVYKITPQGTFSVLTAAGGSVIYAPLLLASDGNLYGVSTNGGTLGDGTAFRVSTDGTNLRILYTFCSLPNCTDGAHPLGGLVEGPDHNLYGTTEYNGANGDYGVVFQLTPAGAYTVLHSFGGANDGNLPRGRLLLASDGYLYGTTASGGTGGAGTIFKIRPDGSNFTVLYTFCPNHNCTAGGTPESGLIEASDGNFYGTNLVGHGFLYKLAPNGTVTALYAFCTSGGTCSDGSYPYGELLQGNDGNFYGANRYGGTNGDGTVFKFSGPPLIPTTTTLTTSPNPSQLNQTVTMTATVHAQNGATPVGNVVFSDNGVQIGTGTLSNGVAVLNDSDLSLGTHSIVAVYQGGNGFGGSTSNTVHQVVQLPATTTTVTSTPNPSTGGQQVTITATVGPGGPPAPTGTVSFTSNGTAISGCTGVVLNSGTAQCVTSSLAVGTDMIVAAYSGDSNYSDSSGSVVQIVNPVPQALQFVAVSPCRIVDTRNPNGNLGGPAIAGNSMRAFPLSEGDNPCDIPSDAIAYSVNVTVVPQTTLGYLTIWPTGEGQPTVSTLNSLDGRLKANAAIVPAGTPNGSVSVYVTNTTNVVLDINGYFRASDSSTLVFYPVVPCRVADTRNPNGPLGGPYLSGSHERDFPVLQSTCGLPSNAVAYSLNFTVVPKTSAGVAYLTVWPQGQTRPLVSTLNDLTNTVVANAALVPAGTAGAIATYATNDTELVIDTNGYFAPPGNGGLSFYPLTPCRVIDTRHTGNGQPFTGELTVSVQTSPCGPPATSQGYVFNATVVPQGSLSYLTMWPDPLQRPTVSTLNAVDGAITSNMAIVPNGNGKTDAYAAGYTQLILDISGYFAP
jgi:uncharacterized repeat protein (TIGR03803 family)